MGLNYDTDEKYVLFLIPFLTNRATEFPRLAPKYCLIM